MSRIVLVALASALVLASAPTAEAFECLTGSCPKWCTFPVPYGITLASPDLGESTTVAEVQRGFNDWTRVSCTSLTATYTGRSSGTAGASDRQSLVGWVESGWPHGSSAIGVTGPRWNGSNCIIEADMQMNGVNYTWVTGPGTRGSVNAYSIALHEAGHYFGLGHSAQSSASMYFAYTGGIDSLGADDQNGICSLYPGEGGGPVDCTTTGCPGGQVCQSGTCVADMGDGTLCSPCTDSAECGGPSDLCLQYPNGRGYCGSSCGSSADCGAGGQCAMTSAGGQCVRVEGGTPSCTTAPAGCTSDAECASGETCNPDTGVCLSVPSGDTPLGDACTASEECQSALCVDGTCTRQCNDLDVESCPTNFYCERGAVCGDGLCMAGTRGTAPDGAACGGDTECISLRCEGGVCSTPCQPSGAVTCETGFVCQGNGPLACGSCVEEGSVGGIGAACEVTDDCLVELCAMRGDAGFCTQLCDADDPCPEGSICTSVDATSSVCVALEPTETGLRDDGGCGCAVPGARGSSPNHLWLFLLAVPALVWWRRRRSRCS